jgi:adenine-specific DNA glycosylase
MAKTAHKKLKPKKKCCVSSPRCRRCPVRLKAEAKKRERKRKKGKKGKKG